MAVQMEVKLVEMLVCQMVAMKEFQKAVPKAGLTVNSMVIQMALLKAVTLVRWMEAKLVVMTGNQ